MPDNNQSAELNELIKNATFEIAGEDQFEEFKSKESQAVTEEDTSKRIQQTWERIVTDVQIRLGTLLKTDTVSFLLGAGASKDCGGLLIGNIPIEIEKILLEKGVTGKNRLRISEWLLYFYLAAKHINNSDENIPVSKEAIVDRRNKLINDDFQILKVNYEELLSTLIKWRSAIGKEEGRIKVEGQIDNYFKHDILEECINHTINSLSNLCNLPANGKEHCFGDFKIFIKKLLTRPLNLKRINIYTLNYDTLIEQATDAEGVVLIDGFVGTIYRIFRPECYDQDLYFPAETTEGRVHRHDRVIHLYKLHGSITWVSEKQSFYNPYGLYSKNSSINEHGNVVIYPTPLKYGETLGMPYAELFRRFASSIVKPQSTLFVMGYGFGDDHVNSIIRQAISVPSFTLVIVDPNPQSEFVNVFRKEKDPRVWIFSGNTFGKFSGFVRYALPDLRDEDIEKKVISTRRALDILKDNKREDGDNE
jgi:hypothetical protein